MGKARHKKQGKGGGGRHQSQKSGPKGPSGPDTRVEGFPKKIPGGHAFPVPGLANLGNTCFFNAVMQNISQSHYLRVRLEHLVSSPSYTTELKVSGSGLSRELTVADQPGQLTKALNSFLSEMMQHPGRSLNPRPLFSEICRKASRFSSFQQQDSQELLRYLLDSMRSEEINRIKRAILASFSVGKKDPNSTKKVTDKDREDIKAYGHEADLAPTFVDEVFGGVLVSTVLCKECSCHSMMHETFLDLSLPIPEDKSQQKTPSPGYQARGRKNKKGGEGGGYKIGKDKMSEETALPVAKEATMSKHQQKKARKQQAKVAKKSKSTTKSLQDFLREGSEADATPSKKEEAKDEKAQQNNPPENTETTGAERAGPTTAEMALGGNDDNAGENDDKAGRIEKDDNPGKNDGNTGSRENAQENDDIAEDNAGENDNNAMEKKGKAGVGTCEAAGESEPLKPCVEEQPPIGNIEALAGELAAIKVADECQNDTTLAKETQPALDLKENAVKDESTPDIVQTGSDSQHLNTQTGESSQTASQGTSNTVASKEAAASRGASNDPILPDENIQLDSLRASLKKFCAPELLTGKNRFACIFCTRKKIEETTENEMLQPKSLQVRAATGASEDKMEVSTNEEEERNLSKHAEKVETQHSSPAPHSSDNEAEDEEQTGPKSAGLKHATSDLHVPDNQLGEVTKEGRESENVGSEVSSSEDEGGNCDESNEVNSHEESTKESDDDAVDEVPKKKASAGKGSKKECTVVFSEATKQLLIESPPLVLNLHLKRFLQYGRHLRKNNKHISFPTLLDMRPFCTPKCQPLCDSKGKLLYSLYGVVEHSGGMHGGHYTAYVRVRKPPTTSKCDPTTAPSTTSECVLTTAPSTTSMGSPFQTASTTSESNPNEMIPPTVKRDPSPPHASNSGASIADMSTQASTPNSETQCSSSTVEGAVLGGENARNFDLSSTTGHWYYISDSHVRTASESEVLKSQAYLLFYERLPFQHQNID